MVDATRAVGCADRPALRRCVGGNLDDFGSDHWGQVPLLTLADELPRGFEDLLSLTAAGELLSRRGLRTPFIRIARGGVVADPSRFTRPGGTGAMVADQVADDRVLDLFADGHTIVLQGLHRLWPPLIDFAGDLTTDLGHPVQVNAYITPTNAQGFTAHYDTHDVFVLQVAGRKKWCVHSPVIKDPLPSQPWTDRRSDVQARATEPPTLEATLQPGDALYLPRGYLHSAEALGETTLHLTVGVHPLTRYDVVSAVVALAADEADLRQSLPLRDDDGAALTRAVAAAVDVLAGHLGTVSIDDLVHNVSARGVRAARPAPVDPIVQAAALAVLNADTRVVLRRNLRATVRLRDDEVELTLPDRVVRLPAAAFDALGLLLRGGVVRLGEFPALTEAEALTLVRQLIRNGVVEAC